MVESPRLLTKKLIAVCAVRWGCPFLQEHPVPWHASNCWLPVKKRDVIGQGAPAAVRWLSQRCHSGLQLPACSWWDNSP